MSKEKNGLIFAISLGLVAIFSASVATFAWFRADAQVTIETTSEAVNITVQAPSEDQVDIEAKIYKSSLNGLSGYTTTSESIGNFNFNSNDAGVATGSDLNTYNIWPGYRKTYCIKAHASKAVKMRIKLVSSTGISVTNDSARHISGGNYIRIENAIKIAHSYSSSQAWVVPSGDAFTYSDNTGAAALADEYVIESSGSAVQDAYFFFTIEFDNNAPKYTEYKTSGYDSTSNNIQYDTPSNTTGVHRYFKYDSANGNHNCYEGLGFNIDQLTVEVYE